MTAKEVLPPAVEEPIANSAPAKTTEEKPAKKKPKTEKQMPTKNVVIGGDKKKFQKFNKRMLTKNSVAGGDKKKFKKFKKGLPAKNGVIGNDKKKFKKRMPAKNGVAGGDKKKFKKFKKGLPTKNGVIGGDKKKKFKEFKKGTDTAKIYIFEALRQLRNSMDNTGKVKKDAGGRKGRGPKKKFKLGDKLLKEVGCIVTTPFQGETITLPPLDTRPPLRWVYRRRGDPAPEIELEPDHPI